MMRDLFAILPTHIRRAALVILAIWLVCAGLFGMAAYATELTPTPEPTAATIPPAVYVPIAFEPMVRRYYIPAAFGASPCDDRLWGDLCGGMQ